MKIIKPLRLSMLHRPYRWQQKNYLGVSIMALADMSASPRLRPEPELWQLAETELKTCNGIIDLGLPKSCAEFLATGYVYTHHQTDKTTCSARIQVGQLDKTLIAFGDRHWIDDTPSKPQEFEQMRLDWSRAFGGQNYDENPHGIGFTPEIQENGMAIHRLPNIETLHRRLLSPRDTPNPANFCPLDFMWPRRFTRIGKKYDKAWLVNEFPGFSQDIDWRLFNAAPRDQWWEQYKALPEKATWRIWNMHPEKPVQEGILPAWQARCFIKRLRIDENVFEEIMMRNTTVWFFPHLEQILLIWHGCAQINEDDASDVLQMLSAMELISVPRTENHYLQILNQRMDKEKGALYAFREKDLISEEIIGPWVDTEQPENGSFLSENLQNREKRLREQQRERMEKYGRDISMLIPLTTQSPSNPKPDELPEFVSKIEQDATQRYVETKQQQAKIQARAKAQGINVEQTAAENKFKESQNFHQIRDILHQQQQQMGISDEKLAQIEQSLHKMYLASAQSQGPALRLTGNLSQIVRKQAQRIMQKGGDFRGIDFTGTDFSGMDLRGANFSQALLESACFNDAQLDGADFSEAILARAEICHASLHGVKLDNASLAQAKCEQSDFSATSFKETQLQETLFDHCRFNNANFTDLFLQETFITHCRFQHSRWQDCTFLEMILPSLKFNYAILNKVSFIKCQLEQAVFDNATLDGCSWVETVAKAISFRSAKLLACVFTMGSDLNQADFSCATLIECNLRQTPLIQSIFQAATLNNSDLSEANCQLANMQYLNTTKSIFTRTDFREAQLNNANLLGAFMQKCSFDGADLREANLFRADMSQSTIDDATMIDSAYTHSTKTLPKRDQEVI
ncbi:DUF2169 family type VI secretion system accessory protein [Xenorhabdus hominickii]|uniref:Pentapeptide repeat-containing protein n=1 Tax=Xenorhabdus hominickii TaxID=351679 RepID=A0A2G0Q1Y6_XENHO|nr:DUF2169 domain-containing protein [Xenorhabdus hominickii]AOM40259.1 hypothetical protein A9255_06515 [Xenorhabdus hominickii]PHM53229.1 pentapeptide repeat-containing protein [Xenorhabdus hominickii]